MTMQNTYTPPPLPPGSRPWSSNAVPVRFNPTTRGWEMFANGQWLPRQNLTFEQVNAMGRAGQAFQVDYAASGGQANTAQVQREIAPGVFAADNARLSPEGSILTPGTPRQATVTQQRPDPNVFAPDGAKLSPDGAILSLPGGSVSQNPAQPPPPERGNNPNATFNPQTGSWNVDAGANWDYSGAPPATMAQSQKRQPEDFSAASLQAPSPGGQDQPPTRESQWLEYLLGSSPAMQGQTPAFRQGGSMTPRYAEGGSVPPETGPLPLPDAIVGEGLETQTPQFDTPERSELTLEPMPALGPDIFKVRVAEGPTGVQADGGLLVLPLSEPAAMIAREHLRPADGVKGEMNGPNFEAGPLSLPTAPGGAASPNTKPALALGGLFDPPSAPPPADQSPFEGVPPLDPSQVHKGLYPPQSLAVPDEAWAGLPGGAPPPIGNIQQYSMTNDAVRARYDQWLKSMGILSGIQGIEQDLRRTAPTRLNLPTYAG